MKSKLLDMFIIHALAALTLRLRNSWRLLMLLGVGLPSVVQAQFTFATNGGVLTITGYTGSGGAVTVPTSTNGFMVSSIGASAFANLTNVTSVTMPNTITNIGDDAFADCIRLAAVTIPDNLLSIGNGVFIGCPSLTNLTIPNSITSIGTNAFNDCTSLVSVSIPPGVTNIAQAAFADCTSLTNVCFQGIPPARFGNLVFLSDPVPVIFYVLGTAGWGSTFAGIPTESCEQCGENTPDPFNGFYWTRFGNVISITNYDGAGGAIVIPTNIANLPVTSIGQSTFNGLTTLTSVTIPNTVTNVGIYAFFNCTNLTNVMIGTGVTVIEPGTFALCTSLTGITIPENVINIGNYAFDNSGLTNATIPAGVTNIGSQAFYQCYSLTNVCFEGSLPTGSGSYVFEGSPVTVVYYVSSAGGWGSTYENIPTAPCLQCGIPSTGDLQVAINPLCAVENGAEWQVDGGAWQNSGATVANLAVGKHTVSFTNIVGWLAPSNQTVQVAFNITNTAVGNYTEGSTPGYITWINIGGLANWSSPTNWDLGHAPSATNVVLIPNTGGSTCVLDVDAIVAGVILGECAGGGSDGLNLNGHTLTVNGPVTIKSNSVFVVNSGTLLGGSNAIISGVIAWTSGTLGGTLTLASNCVLTTSATTFNKNLSCVLSNYGTFNWSGDQLNGGGAGSVICNYGLWSAQDNQTFGGAGTVFNNYGTFRKSGGAASYPGTLFAGGGPSGGGVLFNQAGGVLDVQSGTNGLQLDLQGGANFTGGYVTTNHNGLTYLSIGNFTINGATTCSNVLFGGSSLVGTNVIKGGLTWQNGSWDNTVVTVSSNTVLTINSSNPNPIHGCIITNYGVVNWSANELAGDGGTVINNYGLWNAQDNQYFAGSGAVFNNYGTFLKSGGAAGYPGTFFTGGGIGDNTTIFNQIGGVLSVQTGDVTLGGTYSLTNGTLNFGINNATNNGVILAGSVLLGGSLSVNVNANYTPAVGDVIGLIGASALSGTFSHVNVPAGMSVVYSGVGVSLSVSGPVPVQILNPQPVGTNLFFQFPTATNQSYTIQQNSNLATTNWTFFTNVVGSGSLFQFQTPISFTPAQRFFRVRQP